MRDNGFETKAIRDGYVNTEQQEHGEAIFATSSFVFKNAQEAAARFGGDEPGNIYTRFTNPTVQAFERRLAALEGAERCVATASGMAAITTLIMAYLKTGDHIVCSRNVFGSIPVLINKFFVPWGLEVTYVDLGDLAQWENATRDNTAMYLLESPSNPLGEVVDIAELSKVAKKNRVLLAVDNCFCTPALQKPLSLGADLVIHSATKFLDGQGRCLGGAILGSNELMESAYGFLRSAGPTMSPFNAWVFLKGLETLFLRMERHCANAKALASWLTTQPAVEKVYYTGLESHPGYKIARSQQSDFGAVLAFEVKGGRQKAWQVINSTSMLSITANLGDAKTTITHPATTTHGRLSDEDKSAAGITEGLIRIAVGLENIEDIKADLAQGLGH